MLDGVITATYTNTRRRETGKILEYAAKLVEDMKFYADKIDLSTARCHDPW